MPCALAPVHGRTRQLGHPAHCRTLSAGYRRTEPVLERGAACSQSGLGGAADMGDPIDLQAALRSPPRRNRPRCARAGPLRSTRTKPDRSSRLCPRVSGSSGRRLAHVRRRRGEHGLRRPGRRPCRADDLRGFGGGCCWRRADSVNRCCQSVGRRGPLRATPFHSAVCVERKALRRSRLPQGSDLSNQPDGQKMQSAPGTRTWTYSVSSGPSFLRLPRASRRASDGAVGACP